jgi:hypothetical protein
MTIELSVAFDDPYIGGGSSGGGSLPPDQISVAGRTYLIDTNSTDWRREAIDVLQQRNTNSNRDLLLLPQNVWRHQDESWHQGADQTNKDRDDSLPSRFLRSYGIDPWTKYEISLLNETKRLKEITTSDPVFLHVHKHELVIVTGATATFYSSPADATPTDLTVGAGKTIDTTYIGDAIVALQDDGTLWKITNSTTATALTVTLPTTPTPPTLTESTFVAYVKDFLVLGVGHHLYDITPSLGGVAAAVKLYENPNTDWRWVEGAEGPGAVYVIGSANDKCVVHALTIKTDGTGINPPFVAVELPDGTVPHSIGGYLGYIFIGTDRGVRMAMPDAQGHLTLGAIVGNNQPVRCFEGQDRFVWCGNDSFSADLSDGHHIPNCPTAPVPGLGRLDLSTFTVTELTPANASDLVAATIPAAPVTAVTSWDQIRVFAVQGYGVWIETADKMATGWLESGRVSFSVEDLKTGLYSQSKWQPLEGAVSVLLSYDSAIPVPILNWAVQGSVRSGNVSLNGAQFSRVDPIYVLNRSVLDKTHGPVFTRFELRARPAKGKASRWYIPIMNHEQIDLGGVEQARNVVDELDYLLGLVETGRMFTLQEGRRSYQAVAVDYRWNPQKLTVQGDGWQGVFTLVVEEVR